jgi:hypothetical protein
MPRLDKGCLDALLIFVAKFGMLHELPGLQYRPAVAGLARRMHAIDESASAVRPHLV